MPETRPGPDPALHEATARATEQTSILRPTAPIGRVTFGVLATGLAAAVALLAQRYLEGELVSALFLLAVFVSTRQGGISGGITATILSAIVYDWLPAGTHVFFATQGPTEAVRLAVFFAMSTFIVHAVGRQQHSLRLAAASEQRARLAARQLEDEAQQRRAAEARAEQQAHFLETVLGSLHDAVISVDREGRISYVNHAAIELTGHPANQLLGAKADNVMCVRDETTGEETAPIVLQVLQDGVPRNDGDHRVIERQDGSIVPVDVSATPLYAGEEHEQASPQGAVSIFRDVRERRAAEQALRSSEERFRLASEAGGMGVWVWNPAKDRATWNATLASMIGESASEYHGPADVFFDKVHPDDLPRLREALTAAISEAMPFSCEFRIVLPSETPRWLLTAGRVIASAQHGGHVSLAGVTFDVTDRRQAEERVRELNRDLEALTQRLQATNNALREHATQLEDLNTAKTKFLSNMSHELRTPLNTICGFVELLLEQEDGELTDRQLRHLRNVDASARHLIRVVSDVLDLSRIAAGRVNIQSERFSFAELGDEVTAAFQPVAQEQGVSLASHVEPTLEIHADRQRMRQVLNNLVSNAIKFTPQGGSVRLEGRQYNGLAEICVVDTGIGIPDQEKDRIFGEFEQVHHAEFRPRERGSGLGLAITRQLLTLQGGSIEVESSPGKGSRFRVLLPIKG
jgi:PAS domain S-box-containing protein